MHYCPTFYLLAHICNISCAARDSRNWVKEKTQNTVSSENESVYSFGKHYKAYNAKLEGIATRNKFAKGEKEPNSGELIKIADDKILGEGSYGRVVEAKRTDPSKAVGENRYAMKIVDWEEEKKASFAEFLNREVNVLKELDHPFINKMHWYFWSEIPVEYLPGDNFATRAAKKKKKPDITKSELRKGKKSLIDLEPNHTYLFMVMEFCHGGTLEDLRDSIASTYKKENRPHIVPFTEAQLRFYMAQIVLVLKYLREKNIMHRDIKADNILLTKDGYIQLADFGLAKVQDKSNKPRYNVPVPQACKNLVAIEQTGRNSEPLIKNVKTYNSAVDLYSFGATSFNLFFGRNVHVYRTIGEMAELVVENDVTIPDSMGGVTVSEEFKDLLRGLLAKKPEDRLGNRVDYQTLLRGTSHGKIGSVSFSFKLGSKDEQVKEKARAQRERVDGMQELQNHSWFNMKLDNTRLGKPVDWDKLMKKEMAVVPFSPNTDNKGTFNYKDYRGKQFGLKDYENKHDENEKSGHPGKEIRSHMEPQNQI
ncbi:protein kinase domain-containing protein [Ditylenchus destructor]|nr:protein kinase domain-containing protein [Ditylenchus destructor]